MIKDYQNKEVLAEMKRQVNAAAKISDREARITFVLIHMISEYHILAEQCTKPDGENNLFRFISWCLSRFAEELETPSNEEFKNPIELYKKDSDINLLELIRFRTPAKNAVEKGLDESFEWPDKVLSGPIMFPTKSGKRTSCRRPTQRCSDYISLIHRPRI